jgi:hypothetical protein
VFKITDPGGSERSTENTHPLFPVFVTHRCEALNVNEVSGIEFDVFLEDAGIPAVKVAYFEKHGDFLVLANQPFDLWHVIVFAKLPADNHFQRLPRVLFL